MSETRCAYAGCQLPRQVGQFLCADHKARPRTLKESIAAGPRFELVDAKPAYCAACHYIEDIDIATGLCLACWRAWRFSTERKS